MQLFTFIYSKRTGTIAAKLPDPATHAEKAARMDRLLKLQDSIAFPMIAAMAGQTWITTWSSSSPPRKA